MQVLKFYCANEAFEYYWKEILKYGIDYRDTRTLFNQGFYITNPLDNAITASFRNWKINYAMREWNWYLSGNPSVKDIAKYAPIWENHADRYGNARSNYGWQWQRNDQLGYIVNELTRDEHSRRALITIYDGKEHSTYQADTPCTQNIHFYIVNNELNMTVTMRSNDLWFGFCNDQYCFSNLQELVANALQIPIGTYFHFAQNLHIYNEIHSKTVSSKNS